MSNKMRETTARIRAEMGEEAYLAHMARVRAARRGPGGPFRLDYVDKHGRTGSEIAAEAGRLGVQARINKQRGENANRETNK